MTPSDLAAYYAARAPDYDRVYEKPERQEDLATLRGMVRERLAGRHVIELACGTGYWTEVYASAAARVLATDINRDLVARTRARIGPLAHVDVAVLDALAPVVDFGSFDACFAGFWWSHLTRSELSRFLHTLHGRLAPDTLVMFIDNRFVHGSNIPIARADAEGNSFQNRSLDDGRRFEIVKNFPSTDEVRAAIHGAGGRDAELVELTYYWCSTHITGSG